MDLKELETFVVVAEYLHFEAISLDAGIGQLLGPGDAISLGVDVDDVQHGIQVGLAVEVVVVEAAEVELRAAVGRGVGRGAEEEPLVLGFYQVDPAVAIVVGD